MDTMATQSPLLVLLLLPARFSYFIDNEKNRLPQKINWKKSEKKSPKNLVEHGKSTTFATSKRKDNDSVAQLVEQQTLNLWVQGSIPCWVTKKQAKNLWRQVSLEDLERW